MQRVFLRGMVFAGLCLLGLAGQAAEIRSCFTPGQDCTGVIVDQLDKARVRVLVQAYGMTSEPIMQALAQARRRGVDVRVLLDKSNEQERYTAATFLLNQGVAVLIDDKVAIAHNKVMVIDDAHVITGSFNFTKAAQERNAENVLVIRQSPELAQNYTQNWRNRAAVSRPYDDFREKRR
jgi:phosphatidylserine/phosphatidylglycerophosphate/cardiolipin synthase-like enzyme